MREERCSCRCHNDAIGDIKSAEHRGQFYEQLVAKNRAENLAARSPEGPPLDDELAAFFACSGCQKLHIGVLSGRPEQPKREVRERADWPREWGAKPFAPDPEPPGERNRFD